MIGHAPRERGLDTGPHSPASSDAPTDEHAVVTESILSARVVPPGHKVPLAALRLSEQSAESTPFVDTLMDGHQVDLGLGDLALPRSEASDPDFASGLSGELMMSALDESLHTLDESLSSFDDALALSLSEMDMPAEPLDEPIDPDTMVTFDSADMVALPDLPARIEAMVAAQQADDIGRALDEAAEIFVRLAGEGTGMFTERFGRIITVACMRRLGPMSHCPEVLMDPGVVMRLPLEHRAGFLLAQVDGFTSFRDLITISGMLEPEAICLLTRLVAWSVIR